VLPVQCNAPGQPPRLHAGNTTPVQAIKVLLVVVEGRTTVVVVRGRVMRVLVVVVVLVGTSSMTTSLTNASTSPLP